MDNGLPRAKYPEDRRAKRLFQALNDRYFLFVDQLPSPLNNLARRKSAIFGTQEEGPFQGMLDLNPVLAGTPWLFWEIFSGLEEEPFLIIAEAGMSFVLASIVLDHIIDGQADHLEAMVLFHQALYNNGVAKYRAAFTSLSRFWNQFDRLASDHLVGLTAELVAQSDPQHLNMESLITMAHGKVSPIVVTIAGLVEASGQVVALEPIELSLESIAVASQLLDDIGDWKEDLGVGHMTYYLSNLAPAEIWMSTKEPSIEELQSLIDAEWIDVDQLNEVIKWLDRSIDAVRGMECPAWIEYVNGYRFLADEHSTAAVARHLQRAIKPLILQTSE